MRFLMFEYELCIVECGLLTGSSIKYYVRHGSHVRPGRTNTRSGVGTTNYPGTIVPIPGLGSGGLTPIQVPPRDMDRMSSSAAARKE